MDKWCRDCTHWDFSYDDGAKKMGKCNSENVSDDVRLSEENNYEEDAIFTHEYFGCIWFQKPGETKAVVEIEIPKL